MNRCLFVCAALLLTLSPCLWAQSGSEVTVHGTIYYSGRHTGPIHIAVADGNDVSRYGEDPDKNDMPFVTHTTIHGPGPYSLTIPDALEGHSYVVVAQMDLDNSGSFAMDSFQEYEPSGNYKGCAWGGCSASMFVPGERLSSLDIVIYLSDYEPACVLLDTFETDYFSDGAHDMDYHAGHLWVCDSGPIDIRRIDPNTGTLVASYDLGIDHCTSLEWIGENLWACFEGPVSWMIGKYTFDGTTFAQGATYTLPSSVDEDSVWSVNIAWDGTLLWVQEKGPCRHIYKLDLSDGSIIETMSACDITFNKWLGLADIADICFSDGYLWAMNDDAPTFAKMATDVHQVPPEINYTFAFDPNKNVFDDLGRYYGMVKQGDLIYFVEGIDIEDVNGAVRKHRIHKAHLDQAHQGNRDLIFKLGGQYWFGSLSVDPDTNVPWAKRGSVSIAGNQWDQEWEDADGRHTFTSTFTVTDQSNGSIDIHFDDLPEEIYNIAWNGDMMIHAGSVLHGGGEGFDVFAEKATNVAVNDVLGTYSFFGHHLDSPWPGDSCGWGDFVFDPDGTAVGTFTNDGGAIESATIDWTFDDVNSVIEIVGPTINDVGHATLFLAKGGIEWAWQIVPEEGRGDLGYGVLVKKTNDRIAMADIAGTYQVRFLETGPGGVPYTCGQGTCVIEAIDDVNGTLSIDAYYSDGEHDVKSISCSIGPGNEFHIAHDDGEVAIVSPDKNLIFGPEYRYNDPPRREAYDWLGGIFLVRAPKNTVDLDGDWVQLSSMKTARDQFAGCVIGDEIFVFGGNGPDGTLSNGERYSIATDTWSDIKDNPHGLGWGVEEVSGIAFDGRFYVFGARGRYDSYAEKGAFNYNQMYDPTTNTWTTLAEKPTIARAAAPVAYEDRIYLFGGKGKEVYHTAVESYDPQSGMWQCMRDMPKTLVCSAVAVHKDSAYLIGGFDEDAGTMNSEVMRYDFRTDTWERNYHTTPPEAARVYSYATQAPVVNGRAYLIGGSLAENHQTVNNFTVFNIESKNWESGPALPEPREAHLTVVSDNAIYVIGGKDNEEIAKDTVFTFSLLVSPDSDGVVGVYRLWSETYGRHFYTIDESEKEEFLADPAGAWQDEGVVYRAFAGADEPNVVPVYRFFSESLHSYLYTISESEVAKLVNDYPNIWTFQTVAFYVYPEGNQPAEAMPVYRFWSDSLGYHFYTIDESERDKLINEYPDIWTYESVAWYAYKAFQ